MLKDGDVTDLDELNADPEPADENDPEFQEEMFRLFRYLGWQPEDLADKEYGVKYARWLEEIPPDEVE